MMEEKTENPYEHEEDRLCGTSGCHRCTAHDAWEGCRNSIGQKIKKEMDKLWEAGDVVKEMAYGTHIFTVNLKVWDAFYREVNIAILQPQDKGED